MDRAVEQEGRRLLFTGNGKGKTTAALGSVLRASGHGLRCFILQFLKSGRNTGEVKAAAQLAGVTLHVAGLGFLPRPETPAFAAHREAARAGLKRLREAAQSRRYDLLVLDELCTAIDKGVLSEQVALDTLMSIPTELHVIVTGRNASLRLLRWADTATELRNLHHGLEQGLTAREGVEY